MTSIGGLSYDRYRTGTSEEWMMRIGPAGARPLLVLPPLFEEMNRTRVFLAAIMRGLAARGFCCFLPDLPGTGESERPLEEVRWSDWRDAARDAAAKLGSKPVIVSVRGGALLDDAASAACYFRFAPAEGTSLARDLSRASLLSEDASEGAVVELAGYPIPHPLLEALRTARPASAERLRTVRLESDRAEADLKAGGPALWRRSEPGTAPELAGTLAADIAAWADKCAAC